MSNPDATLPPAPGPQPGALIAGKYKIERTLGSGGMGVVVAARHVHLDELVAVKFLHPHVASQKEHVERFLREGRAAVKIKSEHVARVSDVGTLESGAPYMVMEHLEGLDLAELLDERGALPLDEAIRYLLQACEALAEAHTAGIVHRDLKPANLYLIERPDGSPCIKVLDFGISKLRDDTGAGALTSTRGVMGSPLYMSPEQLNSARNVDGRTDIYALGVILFELLTNERPFNAETLISLVTQIATEAPRPLRAINPTLPAGLEEAIDKCLSKRATDRYATIEEFARAIAPFGGPETAVSVERIARVALARTRSGRTLRNPGEGARVGESSQPGTTSEESTTGGGRRLANASTNAPTLVAGGASTDGASSQVRSDPQLAGALLLPAQQSSFSPGASATLSSEPLGPVGGSTTSPTALSHGAAAHTGARRRPVVVIVSLLAAALVAFFAVRHFRQGVDSASKTVAPDASSAPLPSSHPASIAHAGAASASGVAVVATDDSALVPPVVAPPAVAIAASGAPPPSHLPAPVLSRPVPSAGLRPAGAPATASAKAPAGNCTPPYTIDGEGQKHYKIECL